MELINEAALAFALIVDAKSYYSQALEAAGALRDSPPKLTRFQYVEVVGSGDKRKVISVPCVLASPVLPDGAEPFVADLAFPIESTKMLSVARNLELARFSVKVAGGTKSEIVFVRKSDAQEYSAFLESCSRPVSHLKLVK